MLTPWRSDIRAPAVAVAAALLLAACTGSSGAGPATSSTSPGGPPPTDPSGPTTTQPAFGLDLDDRWRTAPSLPSTDAFTQLAAVDVGGREVVKFSIIDLLGNPTVEWLDSSFYRLHDEWYWFQLLNGQQIEGLDVTPVDDVDNPRFDDVDAAYSWAEANRDRLPLELRFTSLDRLYSPTFYELALDDQENRSLALGSLLHVPARADGAYPERWVLELEFRDDPTPAHIAQFFDVLIPTLPPDVGNGLLWVPRSREQEITAEEMQSSGLPYGDRTIRYDDLVSPGQTEVYADGIAAGRLLVVTDDGRYGLNDAGPNDIVVVQRTPDFLPPGNALITGTPQTPLAHVNVLALNRGIPNAFLGGLTDNIELSQLGRARAPVAVRAVGPDMLDIRALTADEFDEWNERRGTARVTVPTADLPSMPLTLDLTAAAPRPVDEPTMEALRPVVGGKAAGFLGLDAPGSVTMPDAPLAITVRAYFEHVEPLAATIDAMLASESFREFSRARFILLEGADDFTETFIDGSDDGGSSSGNDATFLADFIDDSTGTVLGEMIEAGGLKQMIRDLPIAPDTLRDIEAVMTDHFVEFAPAQGLRFRSSSSVEDIEGFNGAGLYSSNTGYLDPTVLPDSDDHKRTVERALKRTWSSYWNIEAVEERRYENVDHRSGGMAVLVHARFDDPLEISNGVATFTLLPDGRSDEAVMRVNVQAGDTSVTNPDNEPGQAPEITELRLPRATDEPAVERIATSTLVSDGTEVLDDEQLASLWADLSAVTVAWLDRINATLPPEQRVSTLTLDFEFREMDASWPARRDGSVADGGRIVVKQARTLEPSLRGMPEDVMSLAIPRDVLARATRVEQINCVGATDDISVEVFTDPLTMVDMGYSTQPLRVVVSGSATRIPDDSCLRNSLFESADEYLNELFASRAD